MINRNQNRLIQYIVVLVILLVMSWEQAYSQPLLWESEHLPEDAIRLRILPNSDRPVDQWLKHRVRDVVTEQMQEWTGTISSSQQAQKQISSQLEEITRLVEHTLQREGFNYPVAVKLGQTDFPRIQYGAHVYPAGTYNALVIEIGKAEGENWWCVLYPPLCFIDIVSATVLEEEADRELPSEDLHQEIQVKFFLAKLFKK